MGAIFSAGDLVRIRRTLVIFHYTVRASVFSLSDIQKQNKVYLNYELDEFWYL